MKLKVIIKHAIFIGNFYSGKMIFGIGTDLISVSRIKKITAKFEEKFEEKIFTENEIIKANRFKGDNSSLLKASYYAKRFAAKEALAKALGLGIGRGIDFKDIEIDNDELGRPFIKILNDKEQFIKNRFKSKTIAINLSLADEKSGDNSFALAMVIISSN